MGFRRSALFVFAGNLGWPAVLLGLSPNSAGAATTPTIQAEPSTNVDDGQVITVTGSGFTPSATIAVIECETGATSQSGCDLSAYTTTSATSNGSFSTPFIASRYIHVGGPTPTTVDCSVPSACILGAANYSNYAESAGIPLTFNPSAPTPPALVIGASLAPTGTVDKSTGVATVSGSVTCNRPAIVSIYGQLSQTYHRFIFTSYFTANVLCTSSGTWSAVVHPQNGLFGKGLASVSGYASGFVGGTGNQVQLSGNVTLQFK